MLGCVRKASQRGKNFSVQPKRKKGDLVEPMGDPAASESKRLTSIDPDFSIKNGTIFDPKCNRKCNHDSADATHPRQRLRKSA